MRVCAFVGLCVGVCALFQFVLRVCVLCVRVCCLSFMCVCVRACVCVCARFVWLLVHAVAWVRACVALACMLGCRAR